MRKVLLQLGVIATTIAALFTAMVSSAAAVPTGHSAAQETSSYCGESYAWYGRGGWTYVKVTPCLVVDRWAKTAYVRVWTDVSTYKTGSGIWYSASSDYPAIWKARGSVYNTSWSQDWSIPSHQQPSRGGSAASDTFTLPACGAYTLSLKFHQLGPKWVGTEYEIDPDMRYPQVVVPC